MFVQRIGAMKLKRGRVEGGVECEPPHFIVQAVFCTLSRLSYIKMFVLQFFFFKCTLICRLKTFFKNPNTLGNK